VLTELSVYYLDMLIHAVTFSLVYFCFFPLLNLILWKFMFVWILWWKYYLVDNVKLILSTTIWNLQCCFCVLLVSVRNCGKVTHPILFDKIVVWIHHTKQIFLLKSVDTISKYGNLVRHVHKICYSLIKLFCNVQG